MRWLAAFLVAVLCAPPVLAETAKKKTPAKKSSSRRTVRRKPAPKPPPVSARARANATGAVTGFLGTSAAVENPAALVPFFEQLARHERSEADAPLRILHYGDSHTAADEWTGALRHQFQAKFGSAGGGYSYAGRPWTGYRRLDVRTFGSRGWHSDGLVGREGDGLYGLGGVSITTHVPRESIAIEADCEWVELFYLQQPGGGSIELSVDGQPVERISTDGLLGPGYFSFSTPPGDHRFDLRTLDRKPVRLFGWVTEHSRGVTYETLGINGAQASTVFNWDENLTAQHLARRNPALIVLAYGTNEASNKEWTLESYRDMFTALIARFRAAAPTASILVIGPPDRFYRAGGRWQPFERLDMIVAAQREAARGMGCAFWDLRRQMGGKGSMRQWVTAGLAQYDHVHFTAPGYRLLGDAVFRHVMGGYGAFLRVRDEPAARSAPESSGIPNGQTRKDP